MFPMRFMLNSERLFRFFSSHQSSYNYMVWGESYISYAQTRPLLFWEKAVQNYTVRNFGEIIIQVVQSRDLVIRPFIQSIRAQTSTSTPSPPPVSALLASATEYNCPTWYSSTVSGSTIRLKLTLFISGPVQITGTDTLQAPSSTWLHLIGLRLGCNQPGGQPSTDRGAAFRVTGHAHHWGPRGTLGVSNSLFLDDHSPRSYDLRVETNRPRAAEGERMRKGEGNSEQRLETSNEI